MEYDKYYGPPYRPAPPDFSRCAKGVPGTGFGFHQCTRKAVCDPDADGNMTTCKQHSQEATRKRRAKRENPQDASFEEFRTKAAAPRLRDALRKIADGHNDPRALALEALGDL